MMRKTGDFSTENMLGMIIAVIGIIIIFGVGVKVYGAVKNSEFENAQKILDKVMDSINEIEDGKTGEVSFTGVDGWFLAGWSKDGMGPDKCLFEACVCVCKDEDMTRRAESNNERIANACQDIGNCANVEKNTINVKGEIVYRAVEFENRYEVSYIPLEQNLMRLELTKGNELIEIKGIK